MFEIVIILSCAITLILLKIFLNISFKKIKNLEREKLEQLEALSKEFPCDEEICKGILNILNNKDVKLKIEPEYNSCLYTIYNDTISIGKFKQNHMKIQTIAHECIHSCQSKKTLWANFIITNICLIYFTIMIILEFANCISNTNIHILIFMFLSFMQYIVRISLENDAMFKAKYVAKEYIEENRILNEEEKDKLLAEYDKVNSIGIPFMNFNLICNNIIKIILFALISLR